MGLKRTKATICIILFILVNSFDTGTILASQAAKNTETSETTEIVTNYYINETTSIKNDFYYLGIERVKYKNLDDILHSELISMICLDSSLYLYMAMPENTDYQVSYLVINDRKYENGMRLLNTENNYRKYVFLDFEETADGQYRITEIGFKNPDGKEIRYDTERTCKMGIRNGQYYFEQESVNQIVLVGMLLESIYQFENEKGAIRDAWNNCWNNLEGKDSDQRSFYYFAFNCYDRQIEHYFTPDKITEIVIDYTINQYTFTGKSSEYKKNAQLTKSEQKIQIVTPKTIHVEAHDRWNSNNNPYEYNTIYKLSEAKIEDTNEVANYNTLFTAQKAGFEWVVHFGETEGYRYAENTAGSKCDIDFTKVEDFSTVSMKYKYNGKSYSVQTDTLVDMEVITKHEADYTESIPKQILNKLHLSVESMAGLAANTINHALGFVGDGVTGFFKQLTLPLKILLIIAIIIGVAIAALLGIKVGKRLIKAFKKELTEDSKNH